jgi:hypothetical protein
MKFLRNYVVIEMTSNHAEAYFNNREDAVVYMDRRRVDNKYKVYRIYTITLD